MKKLLLLTLSMTSALTYASLVGSVGGKLRHDTYGANGTVQARDYTTANLSVDVTVLVEEENQLKAGFTADLPVLGNNQNVKTGYDGYDTEMFNSFSLNAYVLMGIIDNVDGGVSLGYVRNTAKQGADAVETAAYTMEALASVRLAANFITKITAGLAFSPESNITTVGGTFTSEDQDNGTSLGVSLLYIIAER